MSVFIPCVTIASMPDSGSRCVGPPADLRSFLGLEMMFGGRVGGKINRRHTYFILDKHVLHIYTMYYIYIYIYIYI